MVSCKKIVCAVAIFKIPLIVRKCIWWWSAVGDLLQNPIENPTACSCQCVKCCSYCFFWILVFGMQLALFDGKITSFVGTRYNFRINEYFRAIIVHIHDYKWLLLADHISIFAQQPENSHRHSIRFSSKISLQMHICNILNSTDVGVKHVWNEHGNAMLIFLPTIQLIWWNGIILILCCFTSFVKTKGIPLI